MIIFANSGHNMPFWGDKITKKYYILDKKEENTLN